MTLELKEGIDVKNQEDSLVFIYKRLVLVPWLLLTESGRTMNFSVVSQGLLWTAPYTASSLGGSHSHTSVTLTCEVISPAPGAEGIQEI